MQNIGVITTVQRMSIHDGPGIRSTVFMKGCNFRCRWCHNPETWSMKKELQYISSKCIDCGACMALCPDQAIKIESSHHMIDRNVCSLCGICSANCPAGAIDLVGTQYSPESLLETVLLDKVFYDTSGGGVTISGGEPFLQYGFLKEFLGLCRKEGLHTAVETNLSLSWGILAGFVGDVSLWMCDLKSMDDSKHKEWTGVGNESVLENIKKLSESGADMLVRTPVVPGFNDTDEDIRRICSFLSGLGSAVRYELLPFHTLGFGKFDDLGIHNPMSGRSPLSEERICELRGILSDYKF